MSQNDIVELAGAAGYDHFHPDWFKNNELCPETWLLEMTLLQKWLRESHSIHIGINFDTLDQSKGSKKCWFFYLTNLKDSDDEINWSCNYGTYHVSMRCYQQGTK